MKAGWEVKKLGSLSLVASGGTPLKSNADYWNGEIAWYSSGELNGDFTTDPKSRISQSGLSSSSAKIFPKGSLLIGMYDTAAMKMSLLDRDAAFNQAVVGVEPRPGVDLRFVRAALEAIKPAILDQRRGTRQKNLNLQKIRDIPVPLPPLDEQQRIVAILDEACEGLDRARANAEANLQDAWNLFESYREDYLDPTKGSLWSLRTLQDLVNIKHGFAFKSEFFVDHGEYAVLTPGNYYETGGFRDRAGKQRYYAGDFPSEFLLKKGDLLMAMTEQAPGLLGSCILVPSDKSFLHNQRLGLITPKEGVAWNPEFFAHAFNLRAFRQALSDTCSGATVRHTSPGRILAQAIPYSNDSNTLAEAASALTEREQDCRNLQTLYKTKLNDIANLRQSLLQKAFAGDLT